MVFPVAFVLTVPALVLVVALLSVAKVATFSPNLRFSHQFWGFLFEFGEFSCLLLNSLAALVVLPVSSVCLSYA